MSQQLQSPLSLHKFPLLPTELRLKIWNLAHNNSPGRIIQVTPKGSLVSLQFTIRTSRHPSPLLHTNIEARLKILKRHLAPFSKCLKPVSWANSSISRDVRGLLFDPRRDTLFLSDAYQNFLEHPYNNLTTVFQILFSGNFGALTGSLCSLAIPRVAYTTGFILAPDAMLMNVPSNTQIRALFPSLQTITLQYGIVNEKLKTGNVVGFVKGFEGQSGEVSELMICDLDDEKTKVVPWFVAEHHGWCPGTILFEEERR